MTAAIDEILAREAADTLEKLAFLFAFPGTEDASDEETLTASVTFRGAFRGHLAIRLAAAVLPELTANMLGLDEGEPISPGQQEDALKETLNIVCGNVLPAIAGKKAVFDLDPPRILSPDEDPGAGQPAGTAVLELDQGVMNIWLWMDGDPERLSPVQG